jgi:predicted nucleic acid-binding protein
VIVGDASLVTSGLANLGEAGPWAADILRSHELIAPHILPLEVANALRRAVQSGRTPPAIGTAAHDELVELPAALVPYAPYASRVWQLRANLTPYDAWYVAIAEAFDVPLATLDRRLTRATGPRCRFLVPPD